MLVGDIGVGVPNAGYKGRQIAKAASLFGKLKLIDLNEKIAYINKILP